MILQKWFKGILLSIRLTKLLQQINSLYYDQNMKGIYLHKKSMNVS